MSLPTITPDKARKLIAKGALLVDVREASEHAQERIEGAHHAPLSQLGKLDAPGDCPAVIFHCRSGARTANFAGKLASSVDGPSAYVLGGGIMAWKQAGLPVVTPPRAPGLISRLLTSLRR